MADCYNRADVRIQRDGQSTAHSPNTPLRCERGLSFWRWFLEGKRADAYVDICVEHLGEALGELRKGGHLW